jgi:hypothetical protein
VAAYQLKGLSSLTEADSAPDTEPEHAVRDWRNKRVNNNLANSTTARDTSYKQTNKARPRDPPSLIEDHLLISEVGDNEDGIRR